MRACTHQFECMKCTHACIHRSHIQHTQMTVVFCRDYKISYFPAAMMKPISHAKRGDAYIQHRLLLETSRMRSPIPLSLIIVDRYTLAHSPPATRHPSFDHSRETCYLILLYMARGSLTGTVPWLGQNILPRWHHHKEYMYGFPYTLVSGYFSKGAGNVILTQLFFQLSIDNLKFKAARYGLSIYVGYGVSLARCSHQFFTSSNVGWRSKCILSIIHSTSLLQYKKEHNHRRKRPACTNLTHRFLMPGFSRLPPATLVQISGSKDWIWSKHTFSFLASAPTTSPTFSPPLKKKNVGIARTPSSLAMSGLSSTSTL